MTIGLKPLFNSHMHKLLLDVVAFLVVIFMSGCNLGDGHYYNGSYKIVFEDRQTEDLKDKTWRVSHDLVKALNCYERTTLNDADGLLISLKPDVGNGVNGPTIILSLFVRRADLSVTLIAVGHDELAKVPEFKKQIEAELSNAGYKWTYEESGSTFAF